MDKRAIELHALLAKMTAEQRAEYFEAITVYGSVGVKYDEHGNITGITSPGDKEWKSYESQNTNFRPDRKFKRNPRRDRASRKYASRVARKLFSGGAANQERNVCGEAPEDMEALPPRQEIRDKD